MRLHKDRGAFTLVELAAVTAAAVVGGAVCSMGLAPGGAGQPTPQPAGTPKQPAVDKPKGEDPGVLRAKARQEKDVTQVRGIVQAFHVWAQVNKGKFPLPSEVDQTGTTVAGEAAAKDTTANIFSLLIYTGGIMVEATVSPAEASADIEACKGYLYDNPKTAVKPAEALWDPAFNADFTGTKKGNVSYAHLQPAGGRRSEWSQTFITVGAVVGNRGPEIKKIDTDAAGKRAPVLANPASLTLLIHGERDKWEGVIGYNDAHVNFETSLLPDVKIERNEWAAFEGKDGKKYLDCYFFDEPEDAKGRNIFMGIFTKSGAEVKDWKAIWD